MTRNPFAIPKPNPPPQKRLPDWDWPPYRYVPGHMPHPIRHPDGHLFQESQHPNCEPTDMQRTWLRGLDLYDGRFYWEAHEMWEASWKDMPLKSPKRRALGGLIQLAAATLKIHMNQRSPADLLLASSLAHFTHVIAVQGPLFQGVSLPLSHAQVILFRDGGAWPQIIEST